MSLRPRPLTGTPADLPPPARFLPYAEARRTPHIMVDGAPLSTTALTLSHWPNNLTPAALRRDTSTATVFAYLETPALHQAVPFVSNNHFDEDGLFSMFALVDPPTALAHRALLEAGALAGDFGVVTGEAGARLCFAIESLTAPDRGRTGTGPVSGAGRVVALYRELLAALPGLLADLPAARSLWVHQDAHLQESRDRLAAGEVGLEEQPALDLAIVRLPAAVPGRTARRYLRDESAVVHPFAINSATTCSRILRVQGSRYEFEYRYESWVRLASRRVPLRRRLDGLAERLNRFDPAGPAWRAEDPTEVAPRLLRVDGQPSGLTLDTFLAELATALETAPVAWDPYDWGPDSREVAPFGP